LIELSEHSPVKNVSARDKQEEETGQKQDSCRVKRHEKKGKKKAEEVWI